MAKIKTLKTNFTAGELSPTIDGRPDLAKFQNGASILENYLIIPQGGIYRRYGSRYVAEAKDSAANVDRVVRLRRFVFSRTDSFMLEFGHLYVRFYKDGAAILSGGLPYTVVTPYTAAQIFDLHFEQSADVLFIDHPAHTPQKLSRVADNSWTIGNMARNPPPTEEDLTDIGTPSPGPATLTPAAGALVQGTLDVVFTASAGVFLAGDVDRNIVKGAARAVITEFTSATQIKATILDAFTSVAAIAAGAWFLDKSPSSDADPDKKTHLGQTINIKFKNGSGDEDAIRTVDVGKYIKILGGIVRITEWVAADEINGHVEVALKTETANPAAVPGGDWTLEVEAWTDEKGWPVSPLFYQGRLTHVGKPRGTFILSASDDFENYGVGARANNALQYTIIRQQASLNWGADLGDLILATPESIFSAVAPGTNAPLGGDVIPLVRRQDAPGSLGVQPLVTGTAALYIEASTLRLRELRYSADQSQRTPYVALDLNLLSDHISGGGFIKDKIAWAEIPNRHAFIPRDDGQLPALTYYTTPEQVAGWSRIVTDGIVESTDVIPRPDGIRDQTWVIVRRTINGVDHRYIEYFEDAASQFAGGVRAWEALYTDSAVVYGGAAAANVPVGTLAHLEGKEVDVIVDKGMIQTKGDSDDGTPIRFTVVDGQLDSDLQETHTLFEIGLHYDSTLVTMRPAIEGAVIEDEMKMYDRITLKFKDSIGCAVVNAVNGKHQDLNFDIGGQPLDQGPPLFTGNKQVTNSGWDEDGKLTFKQKLPLPQMILGLTLRLNTGGL